MKYIRTKDGIFDLSRFKFEKGDIDQSKVGSRQDCYWEQHDIEYCPHRCIWAKDIINQSNTIEELCDCFIAVDKNGNLCENPMIAKGHCFKSFCNYYKANGIDVDCYLAILTNKGLIYVAKMNDKGELELL